jgi:hypothetical protein
MKEKRRLARLGLVGCLAVAGAVGGASLGRKVGGYFPIREYETASEISNAVLSYGNQIRNEFIGSVSGGLVGAIGLPLLVERYVKKRKEDLNDK